jgi:branched-chain amino acid transport system permease protein
MIAIQRQFASFETYIDNTIGRRRFGYLLLGLLIVYLLIFPQLEGPSTYVKGVYIGGFFYAILAASWALLAGISGQFSFGHLAFMGIGAYTAGLLGRDGLRVAVIGFNLDPAFFTPIVSIIVGAVMAGFIGLIIGLLLLRLRSSYLALFTIAFSEIFRLIVLTEFDYTGGPNGLSFKRLISLENPDITRAANYYIMFGLLIVSLIVMYIVANARLGLFLRAMREDEDAASALGVNVVRYKVAIFVFTSMIVGLAGGVFYHNVGAERITPEGLELLQMALVIAYAVIGGVESLTAAAAGAFISRYMLEALREIPLPFGIEIAGSNVIEPGAWRFALFGLVMVLTLRFARNGLLYPILTWFEGRSSAQKQTVSKRDASTGEDDDDD